MTNRMMASANKSLKLGLIGCGQVTEHKHLLVLERLAGAEVVALADTDSERLRHVADRYHITNRYPDYRALLENPAIEAVAVCVPPQLHAAVAIAVMKANKHLLIEKPLALRSADCDRLLENAQSCQTKIMVGFHMRWHRLIQQARAMIQQGVLGTIESIRTVWNSPIRYDGSLPAWRYDRVSGGGALVEIAVHHFDLWRFLLQSEVEEVFAFSRYENRVDETATVTARLSDSVLASAVFSERTSHDIEVEIYGRNGRLRVSCLRFDGLEFYPASSVPGGIRTRIRNLAHGLKEAPHGVLNRLPGGEYMDSYRRQWQHFIDAVQNNKPVECTLEDGRRAVQIALSATESASYGRAVKVDQAPGNVAPIKC
ncbi:MAG: Gfo/Idh/MocA family protein [Pyrinomonadaceae bacterium]